MNQLEDGPNPNMQLPKVPLANQKKEFALVMIAASALVLGLAAIVVYAILSQPRGKSGGGKPTTVGNEPAVVEQKKEATGSGAVSSSDDVSTLEKELNETSLNELEKDADFGELDKEAGSL